MNTHCVYELSLYYVILSYCRSVLSGSKIHTNFVNWIMLMRSQTYVQVAEHLTNSYKRFHQQHHLGLS